MVIAMRTFARTMRRFDRRSPTSLPERGSGRSMSTRSKRMSKPKRVLSSSVRREKKDVVDDGLGVRRNAAAESKADPSETNGAGGGNKAAPAAAAAAAGVVLAGSVAPSILRHPHLWYAHRLETHPFATKCITSGFISGSGDVLCQHLVHRNRRRSAAATDPNWESAVGAEDTFRWDRDRTMRFTTLGFAFVAPVVHVWYGSLMARFPGTSTSAVLKRTFFDQAFFAPLFLPTFMTNLMMLEGRNASEVPERLRRDLPDALVTNWALWIPAQVVNFGLVPSKFQVLFSNVVGFVWNVYLSWKTNDSEGQRLVSRRIEPNQNEQGQQK